MKRISEDAKARLNEENRKARDWFGTCRKCGKTRTGTIEELSKPCTCEVDHGSTI